MIHPRPFGLGIAALAALGYYFVVSFENVMHWTVLAAAVAMVLLCTYGLCVAIFNEWGP